MGFHQIADNYYTGWHEPAAELQFLINKKAFEKLPKDLQEILKIAMRESAYDMTIHMFYANTMTWASMNQKYPHIKVRTFPKDVIQELQKQTRVVLNDLARQSPESKRIIDSQQSFLRKAKAWSRISEQRYMEIR